MWKKYNKIYTQTITHFILVLFFGKKLIFQIEKNVPLKIKIKSTLKKLLSTKNIGIKKILFT